MGSTPVFHNPYGQNGNAPTQIDKVVGSAYEVVREVGENLEYIKHVSAHMKEVFRLSQSADGIDLLYFYIEELGLLLSHIEEVLLIADSLDDITKIAADLDKLLILSDNITALADLYDNLDAILAHGGVVTVSDRPPATAVNGKMWWESDSGNLYCWYDDGTSGQWVQINIASTSYDWTDILNKPSTFPPTNHTHSEDVKKTGDTMTGNLTISPSVGNSQLILNSVGNSANIIYGQMINDVGIAENRWSISLGNTLAESGVSTGSDFTIGRYANSGAVIDTTFHIPRATGIPNFPLGATTKTPPVTDNNTSVATTAFVKTQITSFKDVLGDVFNVGGEVAVRTVNVPGVDGNSMAWGDGLGKTTHKDGTTDGLYNVALGKHAALELTTGSYNTMLGFQAGQRLTTGRFNVAVGRAAMVYVQSGYQNTAVGQGAMVGEEAGAGQWFNNTGVGLNVMYDIRDTASNNTGMGVGALSDPGFSTGLSGQNNGAFGVAALHRITSGDNNNAFGYLALGNISTGNNNIAVGHQAGLGITTGSGNVVIGFNVGALAPTLANTLIVATGDGARLIQGTLVNGVAIKGTNQATTPLVGYVGEYREINVPYTSALTLPNATHLTICQLDLTPGDWDVFGWTGYWGGASTTVSRLFSSLSLTAGALDQTTGGASTVHTQTATLIGASSGYFRGTTGFRRMTISVSDIVYLIGYAQYTGNAMKAFGKIWARRMR